MNFLHNQIKRSPDGGDAAGGGAASADSPLGGAAPASGFSIDESTWQQTQQELNDLRQYRETADSRFQEFENRLPKNDADKDAKPSLESGSYDLNKPGEFQRFQEDLFDWKMKNTRNEWDKEVQTRQQKEQQEAHTASILDSHYDRQDKFKATNPDYDPTKSIAFKSDAVTLTIAGSDYSAHIHHLLNKNPAKLAELRTLERTRGPAAVILAVGRMESQFEAADATQTRANPRAMTTKGSMGTGTGGKPVKRSVSEIAADWN